MRQLLELVKKLAMLAHAAKTRSLVESKCSP
jgi:hypothetical protein